MKQTTLSITLATLLFAPIYAEEVLEDIIVTSTSKLPQKIEQTTANITLITAEDIEEKGYQSLPEALSHETGLSLSSNGGAGQPSSIFIRGLKSDNLLILLDGVPLTDYSQPTAAASLEHISMSSVESIEIVKGAQSGIWGAGASAGTINIITKGASNSATISIQGGSNGTKGIGIGLSKSSDKGSLYIGAHGMSTDSFSSVSPEDAEADSYSNQDFHLKASINADKYNTFSIFGHKYSGDFDFDDASNADDTSSKGESKQSIFGISHKYHRDALTIESKITHRDIDRHLEGNGSWGPWQYDTTGTSTSYSITSQYQLDSHKSIQAGLEHTINKSTTDMGFGASGDKFKNDSAFLSYTHTIDELLGAKTTFNALVRYDKFDKFDNKATYRVGVKRECIAIEGLHSSANIYTGYKAPSLYQLSNSDTELTPESIEGYELSVGYKKYLTLTYFHNKITDKIDSSYDPATFRSNYYNSGDGITTSGVEIGSEYTFADLDLVAGMSFTHMIDYQDKNGKDLQRVPENSVNLYLDYYLGTSSHLGLNAKYVSKRRDIDYNNQASDVTLDSYTTVDLTYNTTLKEDLSLSITAKNIFDEKYETAKGYSTEGRGIYATIKYKFQ